MHRQKVWTRSRGAVNEINSDKNNYCDNGNNAAGYGHADDNGKIEIVPADYDLSSVINDLVNMVRLRTDEKGLSLVLDKKSPGHDGIHPERRE